MHDGVRIFVGIDRPARGVMHMGFFDELARVADTVAPKKDGDGKRWDGGHETTRREPDWNSPDLRSHRLLRRNGLPDRRPSSWAISRSEQLEVAP